MLTANYFRNPELICNESICDGIGLSADAPAAPAPAVSIGSGILVGLLFPVIFVFGIVLGGGESNIRRRK